MTIKVKMVAGGDANGVEIFGTSPFSLIALGTTNQTLVKPGPGLIVSIMAVNISTAVKYLKIYDSNRAPTAGTGTPTRRYAIPANGLGFVLAPYIPMAFYQGLALTLTGGQADTDTTALTAGDVVLTMEYT